MGGFGLGGLVEQLADLQLGELLNSPPPGFDEAVAIAKVSPSVDDSARGMPPGWWQHCLCVMLA